MGLNQSTQNDGTIYLTIVGGNIHQKVKQDTPGAAERINKKGDTVYELVHKNGITGYIEKLEIEKGDYGKQLNIRIYDDTDRFQLSVPVESKYFDSFCAKIGNADFSKDITIRPFSFEPKENARKLPDGTIAKVTGMYLAHGETKIDYYFTPADDKGKPFIAEGEKLEDDDYKIFKLQERKFYCDHIDTVNSKIGAIMGSAQPAGEIDSSDVPHNPEAAKPKKKAATGSHEEVPRNPKIDKLPF